MLTGRRVAGRQVNRQPPHTIRSNLVTPKALGTNFTLNARSVVEGPGLPAKQCKSYECDNKIRNSPMNVHDSLRRIQSTSSTAQALTGEKRSAWCSHG